MKNSEVEEIVNKFYEAKTSQQEEKKLFDFFQKGDLPETLKKHKLYFDFIRNSKSKEVSADFDRKFEERLANFTSNKSISRFSLKIAATISIAVITSITAWFFLARVHSESLEEVATGKKEQQKITLSDGTFVWLNSQSKIIFPKEFTGEKREVLLEGEAFFQVAKDEKHPFHIRTKYTATEVLGTSFNLKTNLNESQVQLAVISGKVAFSSINTPQHERVFLAAGNGASYDKMKNSIQKTEEADPNLFAWKTHRLVFNDIPVKDVANVLRQYFEVNIQVAHKGPGDCRFKGTFNNAQLEEILEVMKYSMNISPIKKDNTYILNGNSCKS